MYFEFLVAKNFCAPDNCAILLLTVATDYLDTQLSKKGLSL